MKKDLKNIFIEGPIPPEKIASSIQHHNTKTEIGAHSIFLGQIRSDELDNSKVRAISYTAYKDMALQKAHEIREDIFRKYPITCMHIYHSMGEVKVGEICFFVFTSSGHRKAAIAACEETVDRIKKEVPIWGKELFEDEKARWKVNT